MPPPKIAQPTTEKKSGAKPRRKRFKAQLQCFGANESWAYIAVPFSVQEEYGTRARVAVAGTLDGVPFRSSIFPRGDGTHLMLVSRAMRKEARIEMDDHVTVFMEQDKEPRTVAVPDDLQKALNAEPAAKAAWEELSYSHRKEYVGWIGSAKREETRRNRIEKALQMMVAKRRTKD